MSSVTASACAPQASHRPAAGAHAPPARRAMSIASAGPRRADARDSSLTGPVAR